jgi:uncharacterized protein YcsI (UPF0317 family)
MVAVEQSLTGAEIRAQCRTSEFTGQTSGLAPGFVQCNIVILPSDAAAQFETFCRQNPKPCPLLAVSEQPGDFSLPKLGQGIDIRTDVPQYRVWRDGIMTEQRHDIVDLWQDDWVAFALGCSFSFEEALIAAGIAIRNITEGVNVPMYRTHIDCASAGPFSGKMVVSMRPMSAADAIEAIQICSRYPSVHGAPIHFGDPGLIGIEDLERPDFGDAVTLEETDVPLFWACGVTPQVALETAKLPLAITHEPGHMLVTDLRNSELASH